MYLWVSDINSRMSRRGRPRSCCHVQVGKWNERRDFSPGPSHLIFLRQSLHHLDTFAGASVVYRQDQQLADTNAN